MAPPAFVTPLLALLARGALAAAAAACASGGASGGAAEDGQLAAGGGDRAKNPGFVLLQTGHLSSKVDLAAAAARAAAIESGDAVFLRVARTGRRVAAQKDGLVHAKWSNTGSWERFVIERAAGAGGVQSGDAVFLTAWTGKRITVGEYLSGELSRTAVHAKWSHKGTWQKLTIEKKGEDGPISDGDEVFLKAWTGARLDLDTPGAAGVVQARWGHQGEWQKIVIEAAEPRTTPEPATTAAPTEAPVEECVEERSLGQCQPCLKSEQCAAGTYCCPYMKKCVTSGSDLCSVPVAECSPMCYDGTDNSNCRCANEAFPDGWQLPTCGASEAPATAAAGPAAATGERLQEIEGAEERPSQLASLLAWENFQLLYQLRAEGFTCPGGETFEPNPVALKFDCRLWTAARLHAEDMVAQGYFSHTSRDGRSPWRRAEEQGIAAHAENIAAGSSTAEGTLEQFKQSDGHCRNLMNKDFKVFGVGYAAGGRYGHYWTQMFSLSDSVDTSCYPTNSARFLQMQARPAGGAGGAAAGRAAGDRGVQVLAEAWTRLAA